MEPKTRKTPGIKIIEVDPNHSCFKLSVNGQEFWSFDPVLFDVVHNDLQMVTPATVTFALVKLTAHGKREPATKLVIGALEAYLKS